MPTAPKKAAPDEARSPILDPDSIEDVTEFALDAWMDDAKVPRRSMVVYRRADLRADLDDVERQIQMADPDETGANDAGLNALKAQWEQIAQKIADSATTIVVRAVTDDATTQARADAKEEGVKAKAAQEWEDKDYAEDVIEAAEDEAEIQGLDDEEREALIRRRTVEMRRRFIDQSYANAVGEHLLVRLLVRPKMTIEQVRGLSGQIGAEQRDKLFNLPGLAAGEIRLPSAPFSRSSSPGRRGGQSSKRSGQQKRGASRR